jgi:hypothetical protein
MSRYRPWPFRPLGPCIVPVSMAEPSTPTGGREFRLLLGVIGLLVVLGLAALLIVVLLYRSGPIRGHPAASPTPTAAHALSDRPVAA